MLALLRKTPIARQRVLIIEPDLKKSNDKTYCFWANESDPIVQQLQSIISKSWTHIRISNQQPVSLSPLQYWQISSIDLYRYIENEINQFPWNRLYLSVDEIKNDASGLYIQVNDVQLGDFQVRAPFIFDSRNPEFLEPKEFQSHLWQSFHGWRILSTEDSFDENCFHMMDFNTSQDAFTQFVYTLPYSSKEALIEITRFGKDRLTKELAEIRLKEYLENRKIEYTIIDVESGCIPMSNLDMAKVNPSNVIEIGSRNGAIKPSTGYAFHNMFEEAESISNSFAHFYSNQSQYNQITPNHILKSPESSPKFNRNSNRFAFYDSLLLNILEQKPHWGKPIFEQLFQRTPVQTVLKFLDEKSTLAQEFHLLKKLPFAPFLNALRQHPTAQSLIRPTMLTLITALIFCLGYIPEMQFILGNGILALGLILVGIPHGAVDHLLGVFQHNKPKITLSFILKYLAIAFGFAIFWVLFPIASLLFFILYSAWHFGQADGEIWKLNKTISFFWGCSVLAYILGTHTSESSAIIGEISKLELNLSLHPFMMLPWLLFSFFLRRWGMAITVFWLILASQIPLILAFGIYFVGQHSINGWMKIKSHLNQSHRRIWMQSLPFHLGAWLLFALFYLNWSQLESIWSVFFIFIACISLPHTVVMHKLYLKNQYRVPRQRVVREL